LQKVILLIAVSALVSGCKLSETGRKSTITNELSSEVNEDIVIRGNLTNQNFTIQKAEIEINNEGKKVNILANIRYQKEGEYLISMRSRNGIEGVRIFLTKDTLLANDRINRRLYYGSTGYLTQKYGISVPAIPIIFGDLIIEKKDSLVIIDCRDNRDKIERFIEDKKIVYIIDCKLAKIINAQYNSGNSENGIDMMFSNFYSSGKYNYPGTIKIKDFKGETVIKIEIKKIEMTEEESLKFIPGNNYEKILLK
jgi:hypothetical protein